MVRGTCSLKRDSTIDGDQGKLLEWLSATKMVDIRLNHIMMAPKQWCRPYSGDIVLLGPGRSRLFPDKDELHLRA